MIAALSDERKQWMRVTSKSLEAYLDPPKLLLRGLNSQGQTVLNSCSAGLG